MSARIFHSLYQKGSPFALIDCRERRDYVDGHWFGSVNIPLSLITNKIRTLIPDAKFPVHVLDWQDKASRAAIGRLRDLGYKTVTPHPVEAPAAMGDGFVRGEYVWSKAFGEVVAHAIDLPEITPADYIANYQDALLFDVRPTAEYRLFTLPQSQSLPNSLLLTNTEPLRNTGKMALLHCAGRTRSIIGACTLQAAGYDGPFAIFKGGTQAWQLDGHEREHGANRLFGSEDNTTEAAEAFLRRWQISFSHITPGDASAWIASQKDALLFDVSDDAATGVRLVGGVIKVSGTNLIQQTDRSIARYHVPVVLFDIGSGSRAAFAAYWLRAMGFDVQVAFLTAAIATAVDKPVASIAEQPVQRLTAEDLEITKTTSSALVDFRPSDAFNSGHIDGSIWGNISEFLGRKPDKRPIVIIADTALDGDEIAGLLGHEGWQIAGIFCWQDQHSALGSLEQGGVESPIDESALFAGRHHGVLQDARDYLAWEEALPDEIDQDIHHLWQTLLAAKPAKG